MFISRFNRFFARHSRLLYLGLGIVISLSFVVFVTPGSFSDFMGRRGSGGRTAGHMYGRAISSKEFMRQLRLADLAQYLRSGEFMSQQSGQGGALVEETLRRMRSLQEAGRRGLGAVGRAELEDVLRRVFARDGAFDRELFQRFQENVLYRNGYDGADLDEALRQSIIIGRLDGEVAGAIYVAPAEAKDLFDAFYEEFVIGYAVVRGDPEKDSVPSDAEVEAYYTGHRSELRLPDSRRVRTALFTTDDYTAKATVTPKEVEDFYGRLKETSFKGKTLDQVKGEIETTLQRQKARGLAGEAAKAFVDALKKAVPGLEPKALAEELAKASAAGSITTKDSGPFLAEGPIPQIGKYPNLQRVAYGLTEQKPLSDPPIYDAGTYFVACWLETIPGAEPKELDDAVRAQVRDAILAEQGRTYYTTKVEIYREALKGRATAMDLMAWYEEKAATEAGVSPEEKEKRQQAFRTTIQEDVAPYYTPLQKKVRAVVFRPDDFTKDITISEPQIKGYYEEHGDEFRKEEARARQILVNLPAGATEQQKSEKKAVLTKALEQVRAGSPFADLAAAVSEDTTTKAKGGDLGFVARGQKPPPLEEALFSLEPGQVSEVLEVPGALVVLKVEEKRAGQSLADAESEIRRKLLEQTSLQKATEAATAFNDEVELELDKAAGSAAVPGDLFSRLAESRSLTVRDSGYFSAGGMIAPFGYEPELAQAAFKLEAEVPCSGAVKGRKDVYVACWLETKPGELPVLDGNDQLLARLKTKAKRDRATAAARQRATEAHQALAAALKAGKSLEECAKSLAGIEFKTTEPFTRNQPPAGVPDGRALVEKLAEVAPATLLDPIENSNGAILAYLVSRTLPSDAKFQEERERFENMARWSKRYAIVQGFYEKLEKDSATTLEEPWKTMVEQDKKPRPGR